MRTGEPLLFHSHLSGPLNLHLLRPREVIDAVVANPAGAPLNSVEGFVRQVIGWREFVRGIYWRLMPAYAERTRLAPTCRCRASTGPATPTCAACRRQSATPSTMPTRITSSG